MPLIKIQSADEDRCSVHFGEHVAIYDISRSDAEAIVATYVRNFGERGDQENATGGGLSSQGGSRLRLLDNTR
jgi:hypothetical protein